MVEFPIYYPTRLAPGSIITNDIPRVPDRRARRRRLLRLQDGRRRPRRTFGHGLTDEYYGVSGTDWVDAPILENPSETRTIDGKRLPALLRRRPAAPGRLEDAQGRLLGQQHAAAVARGGPDALDRDLDARARRQVASRAMSATREAADRRHRGRLGRPGHRRLLRRGRPPGGRDGRQRGEGRGAARRRRAADPRARACPSWSSATASGSPSRPRWPRCSTAARLLFCCVDTPPTYSGDADLSRVEAVVAALPDGDDARAGDEEHRARRHRRGDPPLQARPRLRLLPRVPQGGLGGRGLPQPRSRRHRRRPRLPSGPPTRSPSSTRRSAARSCAPTSPPRR